ncbi:MAG: redoxin family protein [Planctomycetales bacterium]|nr:redoxin family protein [Planctomycetales bacterium]
MNLLFRPPGSMPRRQRAKPSGHASRQRTAGGRSFTFPLQILIVAVITAIGTASLPAADSQFPEDWFFDGMETMRSNLEGSPAIELSTDIWIGESTTLDACQGKVVVLDFWATWCGPCVASIPKNIELVNAHPDDLVFIGMHSETSGWDKAPQMVKDRGINYPVVLDTGETAEAYRINAFPTYIIIDRSGIVRAAGVKPTHVKTIVEQLIEESGPANRSLRFAAFDRAWFYTGADRMKPWQEQLGQPAKPIHAMAWWKPDGSAAKEDKEDADGNNTGGRESDDKESNDKASNVDRQVAADSQNSESGDSESGESNVEAIESENARVAAAAPEGLGEAELDGVVRVLHFTRPGMAITKMQIKAINETAAKYSPQGVAFVVVCDHQSDWNAAQAFAAQSDLQIAMALDAAAEKVQAAGDDSNQDAPAANEPAIPPREAGRTAQSYHVRVAPVTVVIDRNGRIRATGLKLEQLGNALNMLLSEQAG